jgi:hypothetical protein
MIGPAMIASSPDPLAPLHALLPTAATLDAVVPDPCERASVPMAEGRLAAPFRATWRDGAIDAFEFEPYADDGPLSPLRDTLYQAFRALPEARCVRSLTLTNLACTTFDSAWLLGDPAAFLAREGLPPTLEHLRIYLKGPVSHAGDVGPVSLDSLAPLRRALAPLRELDLAGGDDLGALSLPHLTALRLLANTTAADLTDLARSNLPALTHLELTCADPAAPELRCHAMKKLLRSRKLPALRSLSLGWLDLDEATRDDLLAEEEDSDDRGTWVDLLADSPCLARLQHLTLHFVDEAREHERLVARAAAFHHLATLDLGTAEGPLTHPTAAALRTALRLP